MMMMTLMMLLLLTMAWAFHPYERGNPKHCDNSSSTAIVGCECVSECVGVSVSVSVSA